MLKVYELPPVKVVVAPPKTADCDLLLLPMFKDEEFPSPTREINKLLQGEIRKRVNKDRFKGDAESLLTLDLAGLKATKVILVGLGKRKELNRFNIQNSFGAAAREVAARNTENVGFCYTNDRTLEKQIDVALQGFLLGCYRFNKYKKDPDLKPVLKTVTMFVAGAAQKAAVEKIVSRSQVYVQATCMARDWINEPANIANPTFLAQKAMEIGKAAHLKVKIFDEAELRKKGMNLILAVGQGSVERPRLVHLEYRPSGKVKRKVALVGKGVTFDSGGLSLKPQNNMYGMKGDMSGAAGVITALWAASQLRLPVEVHGICPLVENLVSGESVKPGDLYVASNGKSVEIENTDAEGRLILADALTYAQSLKVDEIVDVATLTGACVVALGEDIAGIFTSDSKLATRLLDSAENAGEKFWRLPLEKPYLRLLKSDVADLKNVGGRYGGAITAALFLSEFVDGASWAHLDIAGPAFIEHEGPISTKGGTGFCVRTFLEFLQS